MQTTTGRVFGIVLLSLAGIFSSASGQSRAQTDDKEYYSEVGSLNVWTTDEVYRQRFGTVPEFLRVRFGQHRGFDRVVFDLTDKPVGYFVSYGKPPFQGEASETTVKVRGKAFVEVAFYPVVSSDEDVQANEKLVTEQSKGKMALIRDMKTVEWFEAELRYVIGLNRKTPFRVLLLSNPARLVIDFKR